MVVKGTLISDIPVLESQLLACVTLDKLLNLSEPEIFHL